MIWWMIGLITAIMILLIDPGIGWFYDRAKTAFMFYICRKVRVDYTVPVFMDILYTSKHTWRKREKGDKINW